MSLGVFVPLWLNGVLGDWDVWSSFYFLLSTNHIKSSNHAKKLRFPTILSLQIAAVVVYKLFIQITALNVAFGLSQVYYLRVIEKEKTSIGVFRDYKEKIGHPGL